MRKGKNVIIVCTAGALACLLTCGKKAVEIPVIIAGIDTVTAGRVAVLDPAGSNDSVRLRNVAVRLLCAGGLPDPGGDSLVRGCTERLSLVSGIEWDPCASALLLRAARRLVGEAGGREPCAAAGRCIDSLRQLLTKVIVKPGAASPLPAIRCDSIDLLQRQGGVWLTGSVLGVSPEIAALLVECTETPALQDASADSIALKDLVAGLVSSPASGREGAQPRKPPARQAPVQQPPLEQQDNSAEALRYRNQRSIRDSIDKHIPNLRQLYKKNLKANSSLAGKVIVTMRVSAGGTVIGVRIKDSEIGSKAFLGPFVAYLHTIRFKPIPENVGAMTFDFPFEFNPEM
ncbi:MAG: AgmX/PglI C-terminal domain-containing protein [Chitinispirillaceae bacterium]|nr:AgmX/PglI C-terminal domain-containing protein [Chitinispirillaceae bacterium]